MKTSLCVAAGGSDLPSSLSVVPLVVAFSLSYLPVSQTRPQIWLEGDWFLVYL